MNTKRRIFIWLDKDLAKIIKNEYDTSSINQELKILLNKNHYQINNDIEITLDSLNETKIITSFLAKCNNEVNEFRKFIISIDKNITDIGMKYVNDYDDEYDDTCDNFSTYFEAFEESEQKIKKRQIKENVKNLIEKNFFKKKIEQIIKFYEIDEKELNLYNNNKKIIEFLLKRIKSNQDIVHLLKHKKIYNRRGKLYTSNSIATKRYHYKYKKNKI